MLRRCYWTAGIANLALVRMRLQQHMGRIAGARALTRKYEDDLPQARPPWQWAWKLPNARGALRHDERLLWRQEAGTERARMCRGWAGLGWAGPDGTNQPRPRQARPEQLEGRMRCDSQPHVCRLARSGATRCDAMRCDVPGQPLALADDVRTCASACLSSVAETESRLQTALHVRDAGALLQPNTFTQRRPEPRTPAGTARV